MPLELIYLHVEILLHLKWWCQNCMLSFLMKLPMYFLDINSPCLLLHRTNLRNTKIIRIRLHEWILIISWDSSCHETLTFLQIESRYQVLQIHSSVSCLMYTISKINVASIICVIRTNLYQIMMEHRNSSKNTRWNIAQENVTFDSVRCSRNSIRNFSFRILNHAVGNHILYTLAISNAAKLLLRNFF